ncbi:MAG: DNA recombination protein RmuC [Deltaproteobacteria bacterium]|nr:DNA recombination protein RmuC [Deltaproteobacteria bacterium]
MDFLSSIIGLVVGFILGLLTAFLIQLLRSKTVNELAKELLHESNVQYNANIDLILENIKASFANLSFEALSRSTEEFLKLAKSRFQSDRDVSLKDLDLKKTLIDRQLQEMTKSLEDASNLMKGLEKDREIKFAELSSQLDIANRQTMALTQTTNKLREVLANTKIRGQWGERLAEDILRMAGFVENVNYLKQKTIDGVRTRPDFTFILPDNLKLNMDVKFPLDNYAKFLESNREIEKEKLRRTFLKDVKAKIKEVATRDYISPEQNTIDYALLFIPNEQIYSFIFTEDNSILDEGIKNKVIICSPTTLFAVLAVIRQSLDSFSLDKISDDVLSLLGAFKCQWTEFIKKLDSLGKKIDDAQKEYEQLITTRRRLLEKPLNKIEDLRIKKGLKLDSYEGS